MDMSRNSSSHRNCQDGLKSLSEMTLRNLAVALDDEVSGTTDQYWRLFRQQLPAKSYSDAEVEIIAKESLEDKSPSMRLLLDVRSRHLVPTLNKLMDILEKIDCQRGCNLFLSKSPVQITQQPVAGLYVAGQDIQLRCEAHCQPDRPLYQWFRSRMDGQQGQPLVGATHSALLLNDAGAEHSGVYCCRATNPYMERDEPGGEVFSPWVKVEVAAPPVITVQPDPLQDVRINADLVLTCTAECAPGEPTYQWYRGGSALTGYTKSVLRYRIHSPDDRGHYFCLVSNPVLVATIAAAAARQANGGGKTGDAVGEKRSNVCSVRVLSPQSSQSSCAAVEDNNPHRSGRSEEEAADGSRSGEQQALPHPVPESSAGNGRVDDEVRGSQPNSDSVRFGKELITPRTPDEPLLAIFPVVPSSAPESECEHINFIRQPENMTVLANTPFTVSCEVMTLSDAVVEYQLFQRKGSDSVELTERSRSGEIEKSLKLVGLKETFSLFVRAYAADAGPRCDAQHKDSVNFEVSVCRAIFVAQPLEHINAVRGQTLMFMCRLKTYAENAEIKYNWSALHRKIENKNSNVLILENASPDDRGTFTCKVIMKIPHPNGWSDNLYCNDVCLAKVATRDPTTKPIVDILEHPARSTTVVVGDRAMLFASAMADTGEELSFHWYKENSKVGQGPKLEKLKVTHRDQGKYWCEVRTKSGHGEAVRTTEAELFVKVPSATKISARDRAELYIPGKLRAKVALLIANQKYQKFTSLVTPESEVKDIRDSLRERGFNVLTLANLSLSEMQDAEYIFCKQLTASEAVGTLALVYFAGHGFSDGSVEYIMPVDAQTTSHEDNLSAERFCSELRESPRLAKLIRIFDCCRSFKESKTHSSGMKPKEDFYNFLTITGCGNSHEAYDGQLGISIVKALEEDCTLSGLVDKIQSSAVTSDNGQRPFCSGTIFQQGEIRFSDEVNEEMYKDYFVNRESGWKEKWEHLNPKGLPSDLSVKLNNAPLAERLAVKLTAREIFSNVVEIKAVAEAHSSSEPCAADLTILRQPLVDLGLKVDPDRPSDVITITNLQSLKRPLPIVLSVKAGELEDEVEMSGHPSFLYSSLTSHHT